MCIGEGNGTPLQYSCLENPMDGGAWWAKSQVAKSQTWLSDFTFTFHFHALEEEIATHSRVLAWRIPRMVEPDGLLSVGSHRVRHDWSDLVVVVVWILYQEYSQGQLVHHSINLDDSSQHQPHKLSPKKSEWFRIHILTNL